MSEELWKLPTSWAWALIRELGEVVSGGTPSTKEASFWGSDVVWFSPADLTGYSAKFIRRGAKSLSERGLRNSSARVMPAGSVMFSSRAPIGYVAINEVDAATNQGFKSVVPGPALFNEYLYYYLKASKQLAEQRAAGTTFKEISGSAFSVLPVPVAPLREQHRIVAKIEELFSELDKAVESLTLARAQLKTYRQALLKAAFEGKLTADWRAANPDKLEPPETLLARIRAEREARYRQALDNWQAAAREWRANGEIGRKPAKPPRPSEIPASARMVTGEPDGWIIVPLGLLIDEPAYGTAKKCGYDTPGVGVLRIPNIGSGVIDPSDLKFATFDDDERETYRLLPGDLLTIRSNGSVSLVGKVALVTAAHTDYLYAGYLIRLRPNAAMLEPGFLLRVMESHALRSQVESKAKSTSGVNNINSGELQELLVPVCCIEEQRKVIEQLEARLSALDAVEKEIDASLAQTSALRQSILKQAFSGRLVPQDPTDEPATALLARLREQAPAPRTRRRRTA